MRLLSDSKHEINRDHLHETFGVVYQNCSCKCSSPFPPDSTGPADYLARGCSTLLVHST